MQPRHVCHEQARVQGTAAALGVMFFSLAYMQFLGLAECAETMMRLPLFFKQRFNLMFPPWAYALPFATLSVPTQLLEVTFWSIVIYWVCGLSANAGRFFTFWAILLSVQLYSSSFFRLIGSSVRALVAGVSVAVLAMLVTMAGSGFLVFHDQIPDGWIWMFWLSPLQVQPWHALVLRCLARYTRGFKLFLRSHVCSHFATHTAAQRGVFFDNTCAARSHTATAFIHRTAANRQAALRPCSTPSRAW